MTLPLTLLVLGLAAAPQEPMQEPPPPAETAEPQEAAAAPALAEEPLPAADVGAAQAAIDAGLKAFSRRRFTRAQEDFQKAVDADPTSAAAHFYLGYAAYKLCEPRRPFHPCKQETAAQFAKAFELDPSFRPVWAKPKQ